MYFQLLYLGSKHERTNCYRKLFDREQRPSCSPYVTLNALTAAHSQERSNAFLNEARAPWLKNCVTLGRLSRYPINDTMNANLNIGICCTVPNRPYFQLNKRNRCQLASSISPVLLYSCFFASDTQYFSIKIPLSLSFIYIVQGRIPLMKQCFLLSISFKQRLVLIFFSSRLRSVFFGKKLTK